MGRVTALAAGLLTFVALSRNGLGAIQLLVALWVAGLVWFYFAWCEFHAKRVKPERDKKGEVVLRKTRRHQVLYVLAATLVAFGAVFLLAGIYMWATNAGFTIKVPNHALETKRWHRIHHEPMETVHHSNLWWIPFVIGFVLTYLGLHVWQNRKYTFISITNVRLIQQRSLVYYMPWLKSYFNQTPYEQMVDTDNEATTIGNIGDWWGRVIITWRLMKGSVTMENKQIILDYIPDYKNFAGILRDAYDDFQNPVPIVVQADTVVTTDEHGTSEIPVIPPDEPVN
jgi:hypothetical protein